jgi:hypothetical protein
VSKETEDKSHEFTRKLSKIPEYFPASGKKWHKIPPNTKNSRNLHGTGLEKNSAFCWNAL